MKLNLKYLSSLILCTLFVFTVAQSSQTRFNPTQGMARERIDEIIIQVCLELARNNNTSRNNINNHVRIHNIEELINWALNDTNHHQNVQVFSAFNSHAIRDNQFVNDIYDCYQNQPIVHYEFQFDRNSILIEVNCTNYIQQHGLGFLGWAVPSNVIHGPDPTLQVGHHTSNQMTLVIGYSNNIRQFITGLRTILERGLNTTYIDNNQHRNQLRNIYTTLQNQNGTQNAYTRLETEIRNIINNIEQIPFFRTAYPS